MKFSSEQQHLSALLLSATDEGISLYKACVAVACTGAKLKEESQLSQQEQVLLDVRRLLFKSDLKSAEDILTAFFSPVVLLNGDRLFLLGQVYHRKGEQNIASEFMNLAATEYRLSGDYHRELRARVNGALCVSTLESTLSGDLYNLELEARRKSFLDIAANICRTRATELLIAGKYQESLYQAFESASLYLKDGFPDDRAVSLLLAAIASVLLGRPDEATVFRSQVLLTEGKVIPYLNAYESLVLEKVPRIPEGHSLERMAWPILASRKRSVTYRIISALSEGPLTKEELIDIIWAPREFSEVYIRRLYSAINQIRKEKRANIVFNGKEYELRED